MILASTIFAKVRARLDDDNSGRYSVADDLVPAVNAAILFWIRVLQAGFEIKRIFPESLSELVTTEVFTATITGDTAYVDVTAIREDVWTIFGVDPAPEVSNGNLAESKHKWCKRVTLAEMMDKTENMFAPGTIRSIPSAFKRPYYVGIGKYKGGEESYIIVRPASSLGEDKKVALWHLKNPSVVVDGDTNIELPANMEEMITSKAVSYIGHQHGAQSRYFEMSEQDINVAAQLLNA